MPIDYTRRPGSPEPEPLPPPGAFPEPGPVETNTAPLGPLLPPPAFGATPSLPPLTPPPAPASAAAPASDPAPASAPVSLTKAAPRVSLTKRGATTGRLHVNLNWQSAPQKRGLFARNESIDLDLGALYELSTGTKGVIQALGDSFGAIDRPPYIFLDGDDRSGSAVGGENLYINLAHSAEIKRVLIFAYIYSGTPNFDAAHGVVTITPAGGAPITVTLDEAAGNNPMCAVALLVNDGHDLAIQREVRFIAGKQRALDEAYHWGMNWSAGRK